MGFKEGIMALIMAGIAVGPLIAIVNVVLGPAGASPVDEAAIIFTMLGWIMTAFSGKEVASPYGAIQAGMQTRALRQDLKETMQDLGKFQRGGPGRPMGG